jgi:hypothetical protein
VSIVFCRCTRQIHVNRYYYAIVECDSVQLASHLYSELHCAELERSANVLNLSFVPDDMTFEEEYRSCCLLLLSLGQQLIEM